ncbi:MAG TPA: acyltransferase family protein [Steroidobacteraceae bacterium]|nr:acyltransferase family protein [Steroidobacteraceae bacterium]
MGKSHVSLDTVHQAGRGSRAARPQVDPRGSHILEYRPDVDGLRAIAVIAVVGYHAFPQLFPGGFVGVDVFFVISGFLISAIIFKHLARSEFSLLDFYARRARRILPALCIVLAVCLAFGYYVLLPDEFRTLGKHMAAAAGFAANLSFWKDSGYFATAADANPLLHLWSLGIEEQFYLAWPLLVLVLWKRRFNILLVIGLLTIASFALNLVLVTPKPTADFYFPLSRFWELGLGCMLAAAKAAPAGRRTQAHAGGRFSLPAPVHAMAAQLPLIGVALIAAAVFSFDSHTSFPGLAAALPTAGAMCVIAAPRNSWFRDRMLAARAMVFIGIISYPLYLWHWPILSFAFILHAGPLPLLIRVAAVLLSVALATLTFRLIELPIRTQRHVRVSLSLGAAIAALGVLGFAVFARDGFAGRFNTDVLAIQQAPRVDKLCTTSIPQPYQFNYCRRTNLQAPEVVFMGDSQTLAIYQGTVSTLGDGQPMLLLARGGCPPELNIHAVYPVLGVYGTDVQRRSCNDTWAKLTEYIRATRPPMVVLVGAGAGFFEPANDPGSSTVSGVDPGKDAFEQGLKDLVAALQRYSHVVYVLEIPTFDTGPACFLRPVRLPGDHCQLRVERSALEASRARYLAAVQDVQREFPSMTVFDAVPALCDANTCSQVSSSGQVLYSNEMHLDRAGGLRFAQNSGFARYIADAMRPQDRAMPIQGFVSPSSPTGH